MPASPSVSGSKSAAGSRVAAKLQKELPSVALLQQRPHRLPSLRAFRLRPHAGGWQRCYPFTTFPNASKSCGLSSKAIRATA